ncbi:EAL domain-containing protein [Undibacterium sp. TS12]|uniref:bifunctional diguanylate cyclase/phosphodiesterase n=1 Tax=Undibacterium sp. TS12 TaxID=2908202 RepID=UPI001F4C597A|nr:EAL domain-containing protein [Undibacterium sp. TS12]MCH8618010.1 EAL domain-containing protein [Undibacterium sp. TS12]
MTLRRQLLLAISIIFFAVFIGLQMLSVLTTRDYLQQQLASHAQDAATALSRPLEEALVKNDQTLANIQISTLFDRGYYKKIVVLDPAGKVVISKELSNNREKVPSWLPVMIDLQTPPGEAFISSGWRQLGKVIVISHPAYAYEYLWRSMKDMAMWMLVIYLVIWGLTVFLLRIVLSPLEKIEEVAIAIQGKRFQRIDVLPQTRELKRVVVAMNHMSDRISSLLDEEIGRAENFRREAFSDKVSGLENRHGFDLRFNHLLAEDGLFDTAVIFVLEFDGLKDYNNQYGYQQGDALLADVATVVREVASKYTNILGRIGGSSIAAVCIDIDEKAMGLLIDSLQYRLNQVLLRASRQVRVAVGAVVFGPAHTRADILACADLAIETMRQSGTGQISLTHMEESEINIAGSHGWRTLIRNALAENRWVLFAQPVMRLQLRQLVHHEVFSRLLDIQGNLVPANKFLPMALRHQLMPEIDQAVITLIMDGILKTQPVYKNIAVNISLQSMESQDFCDWLLARLKFSPELAARLSVEISEFGCAKDHAVTRKFVTALREAGVRFGVDHFGLDPHALNFIREVPPDYIKLDGGLIQEIATNDSSHAHLRAIVKFAQSLGIPLIAQNVESETTLQLLLADQIDCGQGFYFGAPEKILTSGE